MKVHQSMLKKKISSNKLQLCFLVALPEILFCCEVQKPGFTCVGLSEKTGGNSPVRLCFCPSANNTATPVLLLWFKLSPDTNDNEKLVPQNQK